MIDWVAAAFTSARAAGDIAKSLITLRDEDLVRSRVMDLTGTLMELQQQMMQGQQEQMTFIKKISELENALKVSLAKADLLGQYELVRVGLGKVAYALKPEFKTTQPAHFCCNQCYDNGKRSIFEGYDPDEGMMSFICHACRYCLTVEVAHVPQEMLAR